MHVCLVYAHDSTGVSVSVAAYCMMQLEEIVLKFNVLVHLVIYREAYIGVIWSMLTTYCHLNKEMLHV